MKWLMLIYLKGQSALYLKAIVYRRVQDVLIVSYLHTSNTTWFQIRTVYETTLQSMLWWKDKISSSLFDTVLTKLSRTALNRRSLAFIKYFKVNFDLTSHWCFVNDLHYQLFSNLQAWKSTKDNVCQCSHYINLKDMLSFVILYGAIRLCSSIIYTPKIKFKEYTRLRNHNAITNNRVVRQSL